MNFPAARTIISSVRKSCDVSIYSQASRVWPNIVFRSLCGCFIECHIVQQICCVLFLISHIFGKGIKGRTNTTNVFNVS